jgi:hypothetical protein
VAYYGDQSPTIGTRLERIQGCIQACVIEASETFVQEEGIQAPTGSRCQLDQSQGEREAGEKAFTAGKSPGGSRLARLPIDNVKIGRKAEALIGHLTQEAARDTEENLLSSFHNLSQESSVQEIRSHCLQSCKEVRATLDFPIQLLDMILKCSESLGLLSRRHLIGDRPAPCPEELVEIGESALLEQFVLLVPKVFAFPAYKIDVFPRLAL